jgi:PTH1 family peptidyl-tRNA hydrolase
MQLWVGLGNPGPQYAMHRHNVGFMAADVIADVHDFPAPAKKFQGWIQDGRIGSERILLLKPGTFMNESGRSVRAALDFYKLTAQDVTAFYDELDLTPMKVKVKQGGGAAGHNGIRSMIQHIGEDFRRVRIGIGHPGTQGPRHRPCARQLPQERNGAADRPARRHRCRSQMARRRQ